MTGGVDGLRDLSVGMLGFPILSVVIKWRLDALGPCDRVLRTLQHAASIRRPRRLAYIHGMCMAR